MADHPEKILSKYPSGKKELLIPLLQEIQRESGHLTEQSLRMVSTHLDIPLNKIYGVATFYDQFRFGKKGLYHIQFCGGTSCHVNRSSPLLYETEKLLQIEAGRVTKDGRFSLEIVSCLGACSNSPSMVINGVSHGNMTTEKLNRILTGLMAGSKK